MMSHIRLSFMCAPHSRASMIGRKTYIISRKSPLCNLKHGAELGKRVRAIATAAFARVRYFRTMPTTNRVGTRCTIVYSISVTLSHSQIHPQYDRSRRIQYRRACCSLMQTGENVFSPERIIDTIIGTIGFFLVARTQSPPPRMECPAILA